MSYLFGRDLMLEIPAGNVDDHSSVNKFGENSDSTKDVYEDVWNGGGTYTFPTSATITHIRSAVDSATTQGATIEVQGLDANWDLVVQTKDLDGTDSEDEVALDTPLIRVFRMKVLEDDVMDEDIWAGDDDFVLGAANAIIDAGDNQTLMAIYTVPNGKTGYITSYYGDYVRDATKDPDSVEFKLWMADRDNTYEFQLKHEKGFPKQAPGFQHLFKPYLRVNQKTDIKLSAEPSAKDTHVHGGFDIILVDN